MVSLVLERGYFDFLNPFTSPEGGTPLSVFSNQMLQAENSFGRFARTRGRFNRPFGSPAPPHGRFRLHIHRVITRASRARVALAKDLRCFCLQALDECRFCVIEDPKFEFRDLGQ